MQFSTANALAVADLIVAVTKLDEFDVEGTKEMMRGVYEVLGKRIGIIVNRVVGKEAYDPDLAQRLERELGGHVLGVVPCYCDVQLTGGVAIYALTQPGHTFPKTLKEISTRIIQECRESAVAK